VTPDTPTTKQIIADHDQYLAPNYARLPVAMVQGRGAQLTDADGNQYLDLFAGFGAGLLGHCHPDLVEAITNQANKLWHVGNLLHTEPQVRAAHAIAEHGFAGQSFFCHAGADANAAAIKLSRLFGRQKPGPNGARHKIITAEKSFHGRSFSTMPATGQEAVREGFDPLPPGFSHVPFGDSAAIENAIDGDTVAVMLEPIQGEGGVVVPDDDYLPAVRRLCDRHNLLLIFDEVWTGAGRTGKWFAHQHWNITPDVMTLAKGVGGGLPVGVMCAKPGLATLFDARQHGVKHASTLGGNPIAMAATAALFHVIQRDNLLDHAASLGQKALGRLQRFADSQPAVKTARGKGLFLGLELDPEASDRRFDSPRDVVLQCLDQGLIVNLAQSRVIRLAPPLTITENELNRGLDILENAIAA
jgi:predicted acetylornithine/succinylornithine family transaminase